MTSATVRQARGAGRGEGYWMVVFAASPLGVVGIVNQAENRLHTIKAVLVATLG